MGKQPEPAPGMDWLNVYIDRELKQWVRVQAATAGQSMSEWVSAMLSRRRARDKSA